MDTTTTSRLRAELAANRNELVSARIAEQQAREKVQITASLVRDRIRNVRCSLDEVNGLRIKSPADDPLRAEHAYLTKELRDLYDLVGLGE
jgi:hypothetical protein